MMKATEFLNYIGDHEKELKSALRAGLRLDREEAAELYQAATLKAYNAIERGSKVTSCKGYFFIVCRSILMDKARKEKKRQRETIDPDKHDWQQEATPPASQHKLFADTVRGLLMILADRFGEEITALYIINKLDRAKWNYSRISRDAGINARDVSGILKKVDAYLHSNPTAQTMLQRAKMEIYN